VGFLLGFGCDFVVWVLISGLRVLSDSWVFRVLICVETAIGFGGGPVLNMPWPLRGRMQMITNKQTAVKNHNSALIPAIIILTVLALFSPPRSKSKINARTRNILTPHRLHPPSYPALQLPKPTSQPHPALSTPSSRSPNPRNHASTPPKTHLNTPGTLTRRNGMRSTSEYGIKL